MKSYIPAIDGLRAVAILLVVFTHLWPKGPIPGGMGVTLFFFISGYLITGLLIDEKDRTNTIDVGTFYIRRFMRLGPALLTMVAIVSLIYLIHFQVYSTKVLLAAVLYFTNYYEIAGGVSPVPFGPLWSLAVEEHFYLVFPLVIACFWQFRERLFYALIIVCMAVLIWRCVLVAAGANEFRTYLGTDTRIDSILYGCLLAIASRLYKDPAWLASLPLAMVALVLLIACLVIRDPAFRETLRYTIQGIAVSPLFYFLLTRKSVARTILETAPAVWVGKISYSLYLWHFPILVMVGRDNPLCIPVSILIAALSYYLVETPLRGWARQRFRHCSVV